MAAIAIAVVGKNNHPLYMKEFRPAEDLSDDTLFGLPSSSSHEDERKNSDSSMPGGFQCSSRYQFIMHAALDRFEKLAGPPPGYGGTDGMFVGLLAPIEEMRVYGKSFSNWKKLTLVQR